MAYQPSATILQSLELFTKWLAQTLSFVPFLNLLLYFLAVSGRVVLHRLNLAGDKQADLSVHGGTNKAVYVYPAEHYDDWRQELPGISLPWGMFGENFTTLRG